MEVNKNNIKDLKNTKEHIIILFYADWCSACQRFKPTWEKFNKTFPKDKNSKKVKVYQIEDTQIKTFKRYKFIKSLHKDLQGYPTVFYINSDKETDMLIGSDKTKKELKTKMNEFFEFKS